MERNYTWRKYVQYMVGCIHENDVPIRGDIHAEGIDTKMTHMKGTYTRWT